MKLCLLLLAITLAVIPHHADACSIIFPEPEQNFQESQLVVLARPVAISYRPKGAGPRLDSEFRQTILWEVLLSWKGGLKSGDRFTTRRMFSPSPCSSYFPVHSKEAQLLFARGQEPYSDFHPFNPQYASHYFQFLAGKPSR